MHEFCGSGDGEFGQGLKTSELVIIHKYTLLAVRDAEGMVIKSETSHSRGATNIILCPVE
jgi:Ni2+-binding GTPase involved in maturation of urease and hydrogenase